MILVPVLRAGTPCHVRFWLKLDDSWGSGFFGLLLFSEGLDATATNFEGVHPGVFPVTGSEGDPSRGGRNVLQGLQLLEEGRTVGAAPFDRFQCRTHGVVTERGGDVLVATESGAVEIHEFLNGGQRALIVVLGDEDGIVDVVAPVARDLREIPAITAEELGFDEGQRRPEA